MLQALLCLLSVLQVVNNFDDDSFSSCVGCLFVALCVWCRLADVFAFSSAHYSTTRHRVKSQVDIGAAKVWSNNDTSNRLKKKKIQALLL